MDASLLADQIDTALRERATPERAEQERAYLKSGLEHYGTSVPAIRSVAKAVASQHPELSHDDAAEHSWMHCGQHRSTSGAWPRSNCSTSTPTACGRTTSSGWSACCGGTDLGAGRPARRPRSPAGSSSATPSWSRCSSVGGRPRLLDPARRAARAARAIAPRRRRLRTLRRYADAMLDEKEFFVRKAIGWVLRDTARKRPDLVYAWLLPRAARASAVTIREAVKPLSEPRRTAVLAAR